MNSSTNYSPLMRFINVNDIRGLVGIGHYINNGYFPLEGLVLQAKCTYLLTVLLLLLIIR